jgi:hypothetical protein
MSGLLTRSLIAAFVFLALATVSFADDWTAVRLRGAVFVMTSGEWVELNRGDVVSDDSLIKTERGRVRFERDGEAIDVAADTQIRIVDQAGQRFTTVVQDFGKVTIRAEVENVEHFSVQTPYLAAVVKGTRFSVTTNETASTVKVTRGQVAVEETSSSNSVLISAGQSVSAGVDSQAMAVTGRGALPAVVDTKGLVVSQGTAGVGSSTTTEAPVTESTSSPPSSSDTSSSPAQDNGNNGNHNGQDNGNNGNPGGNDNSGPGNNNGNENDNKGPGNNNGNHNGHNKN